MFLRMRVLLHSKSTTIALEVLAQGVLSPELIGEEPESAHSLRAGEKLCLGAKPHIGHVANGGMVQGCCPILQES